FEVIADAGHIPCVERPERLAGLIRGFLNDMRRERK
ncbi:MAG: 3-oxoadipate enol-lactonase, partial [Mesorhizobium sp.]